MKLGGNWSNPIRPFLKSSEGTRCTRIKRLTTPYEFRLFPQPGSCATPERLSEDYSVSGRAYRICENLIWPQTRQISTKWLDGEGELQAGEAQPNNVPPAPALSLTYAIARLPGKPLLRVTGTRKILGSRFDPFASAFESDASGSGVDGVNDLGGVRTCSAACFCNFLASI